jgi:hypothetical protein
MQKKSDLIFLSVTRSARGGIEDVCRDPDSTRFRLRIQDGKPRIPSASARNSSYGEDETQAQPILMTAKSNGSSQSPLHLLLFVNSSF